jgi:tetratricopeptide (TPR) repeat protein
MKGFMTFEPEDLATAISYCKDAMHIAQLLRKPSNTVANFGRFVRGSGHSPSAFASMTPVQRHAELVYVEAQLLKSCLGIVYSGDFFGFVAEALHMRNAYGVYRSLAKYVDTADSKASGNHDDEIDEDFRSGVYLGSGLITMILGLLPGKILGLMSAFGYEGDTQAGLQTLMRAGGWKASGQDRPAIGIKDEGIRRSVCDMGILLFHLVVSVFIPVTGVDIPFADRILHYHLKRYPNGVFFLYFSGRLYSTQARCEKAIKQYAAARDAQEEYIQLKHISWWDASLCHMSLAQWRKAQTCFDVLLKESNWSKCVYTYGVAANMAQADEEEAADGTGGAAKRKTKSEAADLFSKVPGLMQRIAGKSIPMEKFVAKKASKFNKQGRLLLPAVEFSYIYHCLSNAPRYALTDEHLVMISDALSDLNEHESSPSSYHSGEDEFWDDFCLAHFLRGVVLRHIATPETHAKSDPRDEENSIPREEAQEQALLSFQTVLENGHRITTDHYIIYFSHYELGRLHADMGEYGEAKKELDLVLSGKMLEDKGTRKGNHKYGMQNMALLRSNGALNNLKQQGHV